MSEMQLCESQPEVGTAVVDRPDRYMDYKPIVCKNWCMLRAMLLVGVGVWVLVTYAM